MYRYRLVDEEGVDLGPFVSARLTFGVGERIARTPTEAFKVVQIVEAELHDPFRAYLIVRRT
jgi:hypothetical protein